MRAAQSAGSFCLTVSSGANRSPCSSIRRRTLLGVEPQQLGSPLGHGSARPPPRSPASRPSAAPARVPNRRRRSSCGRRSGSSRPAPCRAAGAWSSARRRAPASAARAVPRRCWRMSWSVHSARRCSAARTPACPFEPEVLTTVSRPSCSNSPCEHERHLAALDECPPEARVEVEHEHRRSLRVAGERQRGVELDVGEVCEPDQRRAGPGPACSRCWPIVRGLHPLRPMRGRLLLVEVLFIDAVRVALERQRPVAQMRQRRPARSARRT